MPLNPKFNDVARTLSRLDAGAPVEIIVTPARDAAIDPHLLLPLHARDFASQADYRKACIERARQQDAPGKEALASLARDFGLSAEPARNLNAVFVQGTAEKTLAFLEKAEISSIVIEEGVKFKLHGR